jgi:hypothetical protein
MSGAIRGTLRQKALKSTQLNFNKVMAVLTLNYSCKKWTVLQSDKRKIELAEIPKTTGWIYPPRF